MTAFEAKPNLRGGQRPLPQLCQFTIQPNIQNCSGTKIYFHFRIEIVCWCCPCIVRSTESESLSSFPSLADQLRETQLKHRKSTSKVYFSDLVSSTFRVLQTVFLRPTLGGTVKNSWSTESKDLSLGVCSEANFKQDPFLVFDKQTRTTNLSEVKVQTAQTSTVALSLQTSSQAKKLSPPTHQVALFDISISNIDCRYINTFEKYQYWYRYRYGYFWKYRYRYP